MRVERFHDLLAWTQALHEELGKCLGRCAPQHADQRTRWLLSYLADRERALGKLVGGFIDHGDPRALGTWVYEYTPRDLVNPHTDCVLPFADLPFDEALASVLEFHDTVLKLYAYLETRTEIPETQELVNHVRDAEEHETKLLAHQANRIRDM
jgi:hypothetical protein